MWMWICGNGPSRSAPRRGNGQSKLLSMREARESSERQMLEAESGRRPRGAVAESRRHLALNRDLWRALALYLDPQQLPLLDKEREVPSLQVNWSRRPRISAVFSCMSTGSPRDSTLSRTSGSVFELRRLKRQRVCSIESPSISSNLTAPGR